MAAEPVPVRGLFETHLPVAELDRSVAFYRDVVGLPVAYQLPERDAAFLWCGEPGNSMLGLWSVGSMPMALSLHVAFDVSLEEVIDAPARMRELCVTPFDFFGHETEEPSVIGWMPAASVFFRDPDGHSLEYLAMLDSEPRPERGIVAWSEWNSA
jgi:lactoylglutathione lyase